MRKSIIDILFSGAFLALMLLGVVVSTGMAFLISSFFKASCNARILNEMGLMTIITCIYLLFSWAADIRLVFAFFRESAIVRFILPVLPPFSNYSAEGEMIGLATMGLIVCIAIVVFYWYLRKTGIFYK